MARYIGARCARKGFDVTADGTGKSASEVRRFVHWCRTMQRTILAVSLPDTFAWPAATHVPLLREAVLPLCGEIGVPLSLMIGVRGIR